MKGVVAVLLALGLGLSGCASRPRYAPAASASGPTVGGACARPEPFEAAAGLNARSLYGMAFSPFGRPERGWAIYAPAVGREIGEACAPESARFAARLAAWQLSHRLGADGIMTPQTFGALKQAWYARRPFLAVRARGVCPDAPDEASLAHATPGESRWDRPVLMRPGTLKAYRALVAAARAEVPELAVDPEVLRVFSAYRAPAADAERCAAEANCDGVVRAACSAHRTGLALDLMVGFAPGSRADSTDDANRLYQSRTAAYRWLVGNAARFGFVNYVFEPWHWEWTGEAP